MAVPARLLGRRARARVIRLLSVEQGFLARRDARGHPPCVRVRRRRAGRGGCPGRAVRARSSPHQDHHRQPARHTRAGARLRQGRRDVDVNRSRRRAQVRRPHRAAAAAALAPRPRGDERLVAPERGPARPVQEDQARQGRRGRAGASAFHLAAGAAAGPRARGRRNRAARRLWHRGVRCAPVPTRRPAAPHPLAHHRTSGRAHRSRVRTAWRPEPRHLPGSQPTGAGGRRPGRAHRRVGGLGLLARGRPGHAVGAGLRAVPAG